MVKSKVTKGDIIASTLDCYRERTLNIPQENPISFEVIKNRVETLIKKQNKVLLEIKDSYSVQTVVVTFTKAYDRWAVGQSICYFEGEEIKVPYTVHYSDILCKKLGIKTIVQGSVNPIA
ncbi:RNA-binding protein [Bacillus phage vB_BceH_LY2]|nr:RNA-binding protein [Bacillus phage vB_BceH_LY2]